MEDQNIITGIFNNDFNTTFGVIEYDNIMHLNEQHQLIHGDFVQYNSTTNEIIILNRTQNIISGVLNLSGPIMGKTKKSVYKMFKPSDSRYPNFIVSTKKTQSEPDVYVIIKFKEWGKRYPIGICENKIGNIGNYNDEKEFLMYRNNIKFKNYRNFDPTEYLTDLHPNRELIEQDIFSIDPYGCEDIDDALHYNENNNLIEVGIHIADVSSYISLESPLELEISKRCESQYLDWVQNDMFPKELVDLMTLSDKKESRSFSVIIYFDNDYNIIDYTFKKTLIQVNKNMSYEEANEYINTKHPISQLYKIANVLYDRKYSTDIIKEPFNIHKMVEVYMVLTNVLAAQKIKEMGLYTSISRVHKKIDLDLDCDPDIANKINIYHTDKAKYIYGEGEHGGLDEKLYTHFTSPIRRYVDIIIHRMVYNSILNKCSDITINELNEQIIVINQVHDNLKKAERESKLLVQIYDLYQNNITNIDTFGFIVAIYDNNIKVHVPDMNLDVNCRFYQSFLDIENNDTTISITNNINNESISYTLGDYIDIKIIITFLDPKFNKKILGQLSDILFHP